MTMNYFVQFRMNAFETISTKVNSLVTNIRDVQKTQIVPYKWHISSEIRHDLAKTRLKNGS